MINHMYETYLYVFDAKFGSKGTHKTLRAAVRKYRLGVCKMKKSKIPKLCQNIGLGIKNYF